MLENILKAKMKLKYLNTAEIIRKVKTTNKDFDWVKTPLMSILFSQL